MGTLFMTCVILLLSNIQKINAEETHHKKSPSLGFQGVRGKRNSDSDEVKKESYSNLTPNDDVKITISPEINSNEMRTNGIEENQYLRGFPDVSVEKRAPMGFMGMRGKKDFDYTDLHKQALMELHNAMNKRFLLNYPSRYIPKRAPSGFMGMRGKKLFGDDYYYDNKRAPSGFMGMRGKKDDDEKWTTDDDDTTDTTNNLSNDIDLYERLQAERKLLNDIRQYYENENSYQSNEEYQKRAPSGFMGMRGKKFYDEEVENLDELEKRAPNNGFFGMRGKKSYDNDFDQDKRAPMGFQGMRGKKDVSNVLQEFDSNGDKRGPVAGFLGLRGKKQPMFFFTPSSFSGSRGKKPEFRGFFGVRGKKNFDGALSRLWLPFEDMNLSQIQSAGSDQSTNKRVPSGFVGMRGKRSTV